MGTSSATMVGGPGVSRIDQPSRRTHGWFVRVRVPGRVLAKFFPDLRCGGKRRALASARRYRERVRAAASGRMPSGLGSAYLSRMDYERVRGWWVRVRTGGRAESRLFSDSRCGGTEAAREEAARWRDAIAVHLGLATPSDAVDA